MMKLLLVLAFLPFLEAFAPCASRSGVASLSRPRSVVVDRHQPLQMIDQKRRVSCCVPFILNHLSAATLTINSLLFTITQQRELGLPDDADEYDLDVALNNNTDAGITKIIAGSFILVMIALLVVGLVLPSITDYGDGVCSPIQNGGRC